MPNVTYSIYAEPEYEGPEGHFDSGNAEYDKQVCDMIRKELAQGNEWAWCIVVVKAHYAGFEGQDTLGACSYKSKQDFIDCNDYYPDLKTRALENLKQNLKEAIQKGNDAYDAAEALEDLGA